jgi:probable HAF family extracellular repeat protein
MRARKLISLFVAGLFAVLGISVRLTAQDSPKPTHYRIIDLGTLGGTSSAGNAINNVGWVTGFSTKVSGVQLATVWLGGLQTPLGTLGGPNSDIAWPVKNNFGLISGVSENGQHDPLNETFSCPAFNLVSGNSCVAFAWQDGEMAQLPGLGGNNSIGAGDNNRGQIVGWAENSTYDPTCAAPSPGGLTQFLQFEATLWQRDFQGNWQVRELPPYPDDLDGAATAINDRGQAVGISGQCYVAIGAYSAIHALIWENGQPIDLGNFGGHGWNTPQAINDRGVVVGFLNGPDDVTNGQLQFRWIAFLWTKQEGLVKIGFLPGDAMSQATDVNNENQVVGVSYVDTSFDNPRAFIYQNGTITPLNALIGSASANWDITSTGGINDRGEIAAQANPVVNGVPNFNVGHAVLLIPCGPDDPVAYGQTHPITNAKGSSSPTGQYINAGHLRVPVRPG